MKVLKFGGTSVKNAENISKVIDIVRSEIAREELLVVVSAFGGITNLLIETATKAAAGDESYKVLFNQISDAHAQVIEQMLSGDVHAECEAYIVEQYLILKIFFMGYFYYVNYRFVLSIWFRVLANDCRHILLLKHLLLKEFRLNI